MKKILLSLLLMISAAATYSQTVVEIDFNNFNDNAALNGQNGWVARPHSAGNGGNPIYSGYIGPRGMMTPDETIGVFSVCSGTSFGDIATHSLSEYGFDFSTGGVIEIECDMWREWWGDFFGIGYDGNGDGVVLPPIQGNYEPIKPNANSTSPDGGIYMLTTGINEENPDAFMNGIVLPNNTMPADFDFEPHQHWYRWKVSIDLDANNGAGAVTLYMMRDVPDGEFEPVPECQGIPAGLTPGSGDKFDPAMWNGIFMLNSGYGGFDNFTVRHVPGGLAAQFIDFENITDKLVSDATITLNATATSGLPVTFELTQGPATLNGNILTLTGEEGLVKVKAIQEGDGTQWQPAPSVTRSFYVVDPENYTPEITIRRPYEGTMVYMPNFDKPVLVVLSAYIEHGDAIKFEEVKCTINGEDVILKTDYPDNPANGYWYTSWQPTAEGTYNMTASITQSGGKVTTKSNTFEVTTNYNDINVTAFDGDLIVTPQTESVFGDYPFPTHVNAFKTINMHYDHNCVGSCDPYDRVGYCRVKNYRGEWVELFRYITPFGVECTDDQDVTDFTTVLQGLVEFELYFQTWTGDGYNPTAIFEYTKGTPDYAYVGMTELWNGNYAFGDYENKCPVPARNVNLDFGVEKANLRLVTTGHKWSSGTNGNYNTGNAAEFYEATHNIKINGATKYTQHLWRTCNPNPAGCQPQNGTWTYDRSGWCPGSLAMVWNFSLDEYISAGTTQIIYEFDPDYVDECHPNYPDCVNGQNNCPNCQDSDNPLLRVSGKLVTFSNDMGLLLNAPEHHDAYEEPFNVRILPNPAKNTMTISTDYELGRVSVHILNAQGVEVRGFNLEGTKTIDVSNLPAGMYFVNLIGGKVVTRKVVIE